MAKRKSKGAGPGGGEPDSRREGSPEPGPARRGEGRQRRYSPEEKRRLLEAKAKSGMTWKDFAVTVGVPGNSLLLWQKQYREQGPRGLEPRKRGPRTGSRTGSRLPEPVQAAVAQTKARFPDFGLRRVRDYLARFLQLRVSAGGIRTVLRDAAIPPRPGPRRRRRRSEEPRRFERARPGELWQSDITSYLLRRHHRRVYLTVFLDDFSRYVVAWNLQLHQRQELVTECLLDGVQRFGKPREVLTDQGRQYFAWRGKSDFQRLLAKEGIAHVVARTHHPQTLGKCERLWKTVGEELVDRAHPEDLEETRERLGHYFRHYNHLRPHQGLSGMTPADRFFGVEGAVRREVEGAQAENALRLALGETPRSRSFLVGNLDGRPVTVRSTGEGLEIVEEGGRDGDEEDEDGEAPAAAGALPDAPAGGGVGAGAVGGGERGGAEEGARGGDGDPVLVAGAGDEVGGGGEARGDAAATVAARADGALGDDGGTAQATAEERASGGRGDGAAPAGGGAGEGTVAGAGAGDDPRADAGAPGGAGGRGQG